MSQKQVRETRPAVADKTEQVADVTPVEHPEADALKAHSDELLDEIDGLLEENAAEFVRNYTQKGGE